MTRYAVEIAWREARKRPVHHRFEVEAENVDGAMAEIGDVPEPPEIGDVEMFKIVITKLRRS